MLGKYYLNKKSFALNFPNLKLMLLATVGGIIIGAAVGGVRLFVQFIQPYLFGMDVEQLTTPVAFPIRIVLVTSLGGLLLGILLTITKHLHRLAVVDPVEANALKGGKMSLLDSLILVIFSTLSITIGGSVGFEAAMTQLGAGILSSAGQLLKLNRRELRILVSCGTGAGLAAIFGAPLAGTFYALELVIGGYAIRALMPTLMASTMSSLVIYLLMGYQPLFPAYISDSPTFWHFPLALFMGVISAIIGIGVMRGTTGFEYLLNKTKVSLLFQPAIGGLLLGSLAIITPQVMGPGHTEINQIMAGQEWGVATLLLLVSKMLAAIICVGSGFRGGLFSASIFLGAALGCVIHQLILMPLFNTSTPLDLLVVAGMAGIAVSIIGTPIAIILLMIETAGLHSGVITTVITVIIANQLTRYWFGYSFSTWRFHVRGSDVLGPQDIGRLRALTFTDLNIKKIPLLSINSPLPSLIDHIKHTNTLVIALKDSNEQFLGLVHSYLLIDEFYSATSLPLHNFIAQSTIKVFEHESIANYLEIIDEKAFYQFAVLKEDGTFLGIVPESTILRRYLNEIIATHKDEIETIVTS